MAAAPTPSHDTVAKALVQYCYQCYANNRGGLVGLYRPQSMRTWDKVVTQGGDNIMTGIYALPQGLRFNAVKVDAQPLHPSGGILVVCIGDLAIGAQEAKFTHTFALEKDPNVLERHDYTISNEIFKSDVVPP